MEKYKGKRISILGDSISTFAGYIPEADGVNLAHRPRYPQDDLLCDVNETWWMRVIISIGAELGVNDSWAGSTVTNTLDENIKDAGPDVAMASLTRIRNLGAEGTPDLILFYGGTNDAGKKAVKGSFIPKDSPDFAATKWQSFADAYTEAICRIRYYYPNAELLCITPALSGGYYDNARLSEFADLIIDICSYYNIKYVDLRSSGIVPDMLPDRLHPNAEGMNCIYNAVLSALK